MASYNIKKTGSSKTSWEYYVQSGIHSLEEEFKFDKDGIAFSENGSVLNFFENETIKLRSSEIVQRNKFKCAKATTKFGDVFVPIKFIRKQTTKLLPSGERIQERQEMQLIEILSSGVSSLIDARGTRIDGIKSASKNVGMNEFGKEKYADVIIHTETGDIFLSNKSSRPASLGGAGLTGCLSIDKKYISIVYEHVLEYCLKSGFKENEAPPSDIFVLIENEKFLIDCLSGSSKLGGSIDFIFSGQMNLSHSTHDNTVKIENASLFTPKEFIERSGKMFFRIRRRNSTSVFTTERNSKTNIPLIFNGVDGVSRLVITDKIPKNANFITIKETT